MAEGLFGLDCWGDFGDLGEDLGIGGLGDLGGFLEGSWKVFFKERFGRRVAVLLMGSEGWAACSSGCISSVSSHPVSPLLSIIELSSRPLALKY